MEPVLIGFENGQPATIGVEMTIAEAALIVEMIGATNHAQRNKIAPDGGAAGTAIYDCLNGYVFNPYWDAGVNDYLRGASE